MSDIVVSLHAAPIISDAKAEFVRQISAAFDDYTRRYGIEPEALIYTLCGLRQDASTGWLVRGDSEGAATTVLALAMASTMKSIINPEPPFGA